MDVCIRLGVLQKDEKYSSDDTKTKIIFVVGQWVYMFLMLIPVPLYFYVRSGGILHSFEERSLISEYCRFFNTSYLFILILAGIWRGGSYYIFKFSQSYNQKFEMPKKEN